MVAAKSSTILEFSTIMESTIMEFDCIILLEKITKQIPEKCAYPCHWNTSKWSLGKTMSKIIAHLPVCRNIEEENCILDVAIEVQNQPSNIYMKTVH